MLRRAISVFILLLCLKTALCAVVGSGDFFARAASDTTLTKAPVVYRNKVIFNIYSSFGQYSPFERSVIINNRLEELGQIRKMYRDSLNIFEAEGNFTIRYSEQPIFTVTPADSLVLLQPVKEIAKAYYTAIADEFIGYATHLNMRQRIILIVKTVILALLVILASGFAFRMLGRLNRLLNTMIRAIRVKNPEGFHVKGIRVLSANQFFRTANTLLRLVRFILIVLVVYFALYFLLLVIPPTRQIARSLQEYLTNPLISVGNGLLDYLPNLFFIAVIILVTKYVLQFLRYLFDEIEKGHIHIANFYPDWADSTYQIFKFLILFFVVVIIFPYLPGSDSPAFKGISIFVGVLFSLGSSSAIANIIAGIILTYMRAYRVGDFVRIGEKKGVLIETSLLVVRIKTVKNQEITIPNSIVLSGHITDYSSYAREGSLILHTKVTIGYDAPWQKVSELLVTAALRSNGVNHNRPPFVNITALQDYSVEYELNAYTEDAQAMPITYAEIHRQILDVFAEAGVEIMSPMYNAVRDGNPTTIPNPESKPQ